MSVCSLDAQVEFPKRSCLRLEADLVSYNLTMNACQQGNDSQKRTFGLLGCQGQHGGLRWIYFDSSARRWDPTWETEWFLAEMS